jgi:hypothetical protein
MNDPARWTTADDINAAVRRRWDDGELLRAIAQGHPFPRIEVPLRGPSATDLGEHFDAARAWAESVYRAGREGRAYDVIRTTVGGRHSGRSELPGRAIVSGYEQAWNLLGTATDAVDFMHVFAYSERTPPAQAWALAHPLRAISLAGEWPTMLAAYRWLEEHRGSGLYLRQVSAPGVDTKFIERHRSVLAALLGVTSGASAFSSALGFASKPAIVRMRFDPAVLDLPSGLTEATFRSEELRRRNARPSTAVIIENEITYLSVPIPAGGIVLWGKGYDADEPASLDWLADSPVLYWGDIDTHGFAILNRVRAHLPHVSSILMDRETLMVHEDRWGREDTPTSVSLSGLEEVEGALYADLVTDRYGSSVRLEQERIDWEWVAERLPWCE